MDTVCNRHQKRACKTRTAAIPILAGASLIAACLTLPAQAEDVDLACPVLRHGYGPYDYRKITEEQKHLVEGAHFFPDVENLKRGAIHPNRGYVVIPGAEIDYTLRAFPNHPRALLSLARLSQRDKTPHPQGVKANVACYFQSAINFVPDDGTVRIIYGMHLLRTGNRDEAVKQLEKGQELSDESPSGHYNLGLAYFELKRYDDALKEAHKAYALGFPLPGLKEKLKQVNAWKDPVKAAAPSAPIADQSAP
ncbi:hypothetical protein GCM10025771_25000 [Niveibacterium umoris]|uniref:Tetratricopeptide (TPR) repeat protein n=1 Tax=Niveibacterium umoris TaxID=1193620 RepID=A0A840BL18_9RHOO|nr:tetratricopeptide repeat protein [Niveibacterium umoris]MBB4012312.1 tetratricopeptide (TPR) repeat protein [Niveibacterium umoris]